MLPDRLRGQPAVPPGARLPDHAPHLAGAPALLLLLLLRLLLVGAVGGLQLGQQGRGRQPLERSLIRRPFVTVK